MKANLFALVVASAVLAPRSQGADPALASSSPRIVRSFDRNWRFIPADPEGAENPSFDDSGWQHVTTPHDWSIAGPFSPANPAGGAGGFLPTGVGWYRKTFILPPDTAGRRVLIEFGGVMANSDVWINGFFLSHRPYGYSTFLCDLTGHLRPPGQPNVLAVRADDSKQPASRWYAGAGIYRHVRLVLTNPVHLERWSAFVTTPKIDLDSDLATARSATVQVTATASNESVDPQPVSIESMISDAHHRLVAQGQSRRTMLEPRSSASFTVEIRIANPRLWSVDHPSLYWAVTTVKVGQGGEGAASTDSATTSFGVREARFDTARGFLLNGQPLKLKGVCLHSEASAFGAAVPLEVWERDLASLKALGVNAIRTAHNPPSSGFLDLCDRMGFLVMDEAFDCWTVGKNPYDYHRYFDEWSKTDLRDMVLRDRNHPSIILWSAGNEIHDTPDAALAKRILAGLIQIFHENDPTRPVTQALLRPNRSHDYTDGLAAMLDVVGTNYRYNELLAAHAANPAWKIVGTENNHDAASWLAVRDNPAYSGEFIWSGIDYLGESHGWPIVAAGSGLLDRTGYPHPDGRVAQSWWSDQPVVYVARRIAPTVRPPADPGYGKAPPLPPWRRQVLYADWNPQKAAPHDEDIEVYSNCDAVELVLNGRSLGIQPRHSDLSPRVWKVPYEPGTLRAIGRDAGRIAAESDLRTAGAPAAIRLNADKYQLAAGWDHLATITAEVVDTNGIRVPTATNEISFTAGGAGSVIAVDNANNASHEPFQATQRAAFQGRCVAYVRAIAPSGPITITATAHGLASASVRLAATREN